MLGESAAVGMSDAVFLPPLEGQSTNELSCRAHFPVKGTEQAPWGAAYEEFADLLSKSFIYSPEFFNDLATASPWKHADFFNHNPSRHDYPDVFQITLKKAGRLIGAAVGRFTPFYIHSELAWGGQLTLHDFRTSGAHDADAIQLFLCLMGASFLHDSPTVSMVSRISSIQAFLGKADAASHDFWTARVADFESSLALWPTAASQSEAPGFRDLRPGLEAWKTSFDPQSPNNLLSLQRAHGDFVTFGDRCHLLAHVPKSLIHAETATQSPIAESPRLLSHAYSLPKSGTYQAYILSRVGRTKSMRDFSNALRALAARGWPAPAFEATSIVSTGQDNIATCASLLREGNVQGPASTEHRFFEELNAMTVAVSDHSKMDVLGGEVRLDAEDWEWLHKDWLNLRAQAQAMQQSVSAMPIDDRYRTYVILSTVQRPRSENQRWFIREFRSLEVGDMSYLGLAPDHVATKADEHMLSFRNSRLFFTPDKLVCQVRRCLGETAIALRESDCGPEVMQRDTFLCSNSGSSEDATYTPRLPLVGKPLPTSLTYH